MTMLLDSPTRLPVSITSLLQSPSVRDVLIEARALIADPRDWVCNPDCYGWSDGECALTAIFGAARGDYDLDAQAEAALQAVIGAQEIHEFNDTHSHAEVLAAFDAAIAT